MRNNLSKRKVLFCLLITLISSHNVYAQQSCEVHVYGFPESSGSLRLVEYFGDKADCEVVFYDLETPAYLKEYQETIKTLLMSGVDVIPEGICLSCLLMHHTIEEIYMSFGSPLTEIYCDGRLVAVTVGVSGVAAGDYEVLDQALMADSAYTKVFTSHAVYILNEESARISVIDLPSIGRVDSFSTPLLVVTTLIAFIDGFNPCSLWVLIFVLGIALYSRSRRKILLVGLTFLGVTTSVHGLFVLGLLNILLYIGYLTWIRAVFAFITFVFALVNIKDYFWYRKGMSFTIPEKFKSRVLYRTIREIMRPEKSAWVIVGGTAAMALGVAALKLPCTVGFPLIWTKIIAEHNLALPVLASFFSLYMVIYLLDELIVFASVTLTLKRFMFEEKHGRMLKLISGMTMLALASAMVIDPELIGSVTGSISVLLVAVALSLLIMFIHRKMLPRLGAKYEPKKKTRVDQPKAIPCKLLLQSCSQQDIKLLLDSINMSC